MSDLEITPIEDLETMLSVLLAAAKEKSDADNDDEPKDDEDDEDEDEDEEGDEEEVEAVAVEVVETVAVVAVAAAAAAEITDVVSADHPQHLRLIEALLFAGTQALDEKDLADRLPNDANLPMLIADLTEFYA